MPKITIDTQMKSLPPIQPGTLMIHKDDPPMLVLATGIAVCDEFPGVVLDTGHYGNNGLAQSFVCLKGM